jgi:DNA-binding CsgD family transcriptional regulator
MEGHTPQLDDKSLAELRRYILALWDRTGPALPMEHLVGLRRDLPTLAGVTIDLRASEQLGTPMVVLRVADAPATEATMTGLSKRERQVCALIAEGRSNKQIANRLSISLATVKDHVHNILRKTGSPNRAAVAVAYRNAVATSG